MDIWHIKWIQIHLICLQGQDIEMLQLLIEKKWRY